MYCNLETHSILNILSLRGLLYTHDTKPCFCWDNCIRMNVGLMGTSEYFHRLLADKRFHMILATSLQCGRLVFRVYMWCMFAFNDQQHCNFNCPLKSLPSNRAIQDAIQEYVSHILHVLWLNATFHTRNFVYTLSYSEPFIAFLLFSRLLHEWMRLDVNGQ
jgi:hypothetical protein